MVICWHVDYWDYLGWNDPFGAPEHAARQRRYKALRDLKQMGTPQFFVANEALPWGKDGMRRIPGLVGAGGVPPAVVTIDAEAWGTPDGIQERVSLRDPDEEAGIDETVGVLPVLLRRHVMTDVPRGENEDRALSEFQVALATKPPVPATDALGGTLRFTFEIPEGLCVADLAVAVLVEDAATLRTIECVEIPVAAAAPALPEGYEPVPDAHVLEALNAAGDNSAELEKALAHFEGGDPLMREAVRFLVANMPGKGYVVTELRDAEGNRIEYDPLAYATFKESLAAIEALEEEHGELDFARDHKVEDVATITAEYLLWHVTQAFEVWNGVPADHRVGFEAFLNFVLPYRGSEEPLEDWLSPMRERVNAALRDADDTAEDTAEVRAVYRLASKTASSIVKFNERYYLHPTDQGFGEMLGSGQGRCEDITNMTTYAARALGLATAADYTPAWGHRDNNHAWNVLLDAEGRGFAKANAHAAKIYRKTFALQRGNLAYRLPEGREAPNRFLGSRAYLDVTDQYAETTDVTVQVDPGAAAGERFAYLCVFNGGRWVAIHWGEVVDGRVTFTHMGRNLLYLAAVHVGEDLVPVGPPLLVHRDGVVKHLPGGSGPTSLLVTSVKPRQKSPDTGAETPVSHLTEGTVYALRRFESGDWVDVAEVTAGKDPLPFGDLSTNALYWLVAKDSRELERPFTIVDARQRFW